MGLVAVDCDLRRIHAWSEETGALGTQEANPGFLLTTVAPGSRVLFEIAGPIHYRDGAGAAHNLMRWAIFNTATAAALAQAFDLLVAPSSVWTRGYDVKVRHKMAKCAGKNKDLRECEAMLWFYRRRPEDWIPYNDYINSL